MSSNSEGVIQNCNDSYSRRENLVFWPPNLLSCEMHAIENTLNGSWAGRWHLVLRRP